MVSSSVVTVCAGSTRNAVQSKPPLRPSPDIRCIRHPIKACPIDGKIVKAIWIDYENVEGVPGLLYRGHKVGYKWVRSV